MDDRAEVPVGPSWLRSGWVQAAGLLLAAGAVWAALDLAAAPAGESCETPAMATRGIPNAGPDVIVGELPDMSFYGTQTGIAAYSVGTTSCNAGDQGLPWVASTNHHPVIGQNLYRLKDGRFEQIGMSWLKHGFAALAGNVCGFGCQNPGTASILGVGCSDPYGSGLNGSQGGLGPRSDVNASTGVFGYPFPSQGQTGDTLYKRLQVATVDIDPALNSGARYFVEGHYITPEDAQSGNGNNNASYREVVFDVGLNPALQGTTQRMKAAIEAWQALDGTVDLVDLDVAADGRFKLAAKATDNGNGTWHYEYALFNLNSHRSGQSLAIAVPPGTTVTNLGFHDVPYHSGEPFDGTDWTPTVDGVLGTVRWTTDDFTANSNANALRWSTLYSFGFDADRAPGPALATVGLFRTGSPASVSAMSLGPVPIPLFADGFETGDTTAWSLTVP